MSRLTGSGIKCDLFLPCIALAAAAQILAPWSAKVFFAALAVIFGILAGRMIVCIRRKNIHAVLLLILTVLVGAVVIGNTPALMRETRLNRKCYDDFAAAAWSAIGDRQLYIFGGDESIRGSMPFYGNRMVTILPDTPSLMECMNQNNSPHAIMMIEGTFNHFSRKKDFAGRLLNRRIVKPGFPKKSDTFVLLLHD